MNKVEMIEKVANQEGVTKSEAERIINATINAIIDEVIAGGEVGFVGFGTFKVLQRAARSGRNPRTGEKIHIEASKAPVFKAGRAFKTRVNKG